MKYNLLCSVLCLLLCTSVIAQDTALVTCGQKELTDRYFRLDPAAKRLHEQIESRVAGYTKKVKAGLIPQQRINAVVTLPVVVHIIHNNGGENVSDAQVFTAIQNLNAAYANTGFYNPADGVNTEIQFCLAQRDPNGNATNGITRNVSSYTVMSGGYYDDDQNVKSLNRWNPNCYINIWVVREIPGGVAGYAYLPSAHGSNLDGIVLEAGYFGSSPANDVAVIHEMGHYLGLYHTFEGACANSDCTTQGDRVCDTPPDQSTAYAACNTSVNSCSTDALSGFSTDVNDLKEDYMDYGNWNCMKVFTQGQKDRMLWHINYVRSSLLNCKSCLSPCPTPIVANFTQSGTNVPYGTTVTFTNGSTNASGYRWYVNGVLQSATTNFSYTFNAGGTFTIRMVALPGTALCDSVIKTSTVNVICTAPVTAGFNSSATNIPIGTTVNFTNTSANANTYKWYINGVYQSAATNYSYLFSTGGRYIVRLAAYSNSPICDSSVIQDTIRVDCPVTPNFSPLVSSFNTNQTITFTNSSTGATSYQWMVNGILQGTTTNFSYSFTAGGNYAIKLVAISVMCTDSVIGTVVINDTCQRQTFQKSIGGPGNDQAADIQSSLDGGYIIAGRTNSYGFGNDDGYIVKLDDKGNTQWTRAYGGAAADWFNSITLSHDGGYVAVGRTFSYGNQRGDAWVVKMDADGVVQWSRRFTANTTNGEEAFTIIPTTDGGYAIVGSHDAAPGTVNILVLKLDANGNITWNRVYDTGDTDGAFNIMQDGNELIVSGFTRTSHSYHDGVLFKLNGSNGNIIWVKQLDVSAWNNTNGRIFKTGNGYAIDMGAIDDFSNLNVARYSLVRFDNDGNATGIQTFRPPTYATGGNYILPQPDGSTMNMHCDDNGNPDLNVYRVGSNGAIQYARKYPRAGAQVITMLRNARDGGFISIGYTGNPGSYDMYFAKLDAQFNTPGCDTVPIQVRIESPSFESYTANWNSFAANFGNTVIQGVESRPATPVLTELCSGTSCVEPEPPVGGDTCTTRKSFLVTMGGNGNDDAYDVIATPDGGNLVAGTSNSNSGSNQDGVIIKTDDKGNIIWSKIYGGAGSDVFYRIIPTRDGNYVAIGTGMFKAGHTSDIYIIKIDKLGNLIWSRAYGAGTLNGEAGHSIVETTDGGFAIAAFYNNGPANVQPLYIKLDKDGLLLWSKLLNVNGTGQAMDIVSQGDVLIGTGMVEKTDGSTTLNDGYISKLRSSDGTILWTRNIESDGISNTLQQLKLGNNELLFTMVNLDNPVAANNKPVLFKTDTSGNVTSANFYSVAGITMQGILFRSDFTKEGGYIMSITDTKTGNSPPAILKTGTNAQPQWSKTYRKFFNQAFNQIIHQNSGYVAVGRLIKQAGAANDIVLMKITGEGLINNENPAGDCAANDAANNSGNAIVLSTPAALNYWSGISAGNLESLTATTNVISSLLPQQILCIDTVHCPQPCDSCTIDTLTGRDTVCIFSDTLTYELNRTGTCQQPVQWTIDNNFGTIISQTDSTVRIVFTDSGQVVLYAKIITTCDTLTDSITIHIYDSPDTLNLGPDWTICKTSTIPLNARSGFRTYLWQDGSTDSTFTANDPGIYHVTVTDYCGNVLRDTVIISLAPDIPFDLGPDVAICNSDSITLSAPTGFNNYYWSPAYRIDNSYTREIKVNPDRDTTYTVVAERAPGCLVSDTIRVTVRMPTPLDLGPDLQFCSNDSLLLDGGSAFTSWLWSNTLTSQEIYAKAGGSYHIKATDINGCITRDTIGITMNQSPVVNLGGDTVICRNTGVLFNAGIGNAQPTYLWQDGSVNNTFFATQPGKYWVEVTNMAQCKNRDTVEIIRIAELPANFLVDTASVCDDEPILIRATRNFITYRWDGIINMQTLEVDKPGTHILEVIDEYGCPGIDTILVVGKTCRKDIYFPNSFTPNGDQYNNLFKPVIYGRLVKFHLVIFNRWGGKVFETFNANYGWNGLLGAHEQATGTYVWMCTWKFIGQNQTEKMEKGTLILVR